MKFRAGNRIKWTQDHCTVISAGVPAGTDWTIEREGDGYSLAACGAGCRKHKDCYGNGSLHVWGLSARQRKRFEAHIGVDKPGR